MVAEVLPIGYAELDAMKCSYKALEVLPVDARQRVATWLMASLDIVPIQAGGSMKSSVMEASAPARAEQGQGVEPSTPREFMSFKKPTSQAERVACLAYFLARHRETTHFKIGDIAALNMEAAEQKFGNLSRDIDSADRRNGYVVAAGPGLRQLTTRGEAVVEALPDRGAVKTALRENPYRPKRAAGNGKKSGTPAGGDE